jgi:hypothetical protein
MKILTLLVFATVISFSVSAQADSTRDKNDQNGYSQSGNHQYYQLQNGKLVMYSNGVKNAIIKDVTLPDGTTITTNGKVTWKDGKTQTLQDGELSCPKIGLHKKSVKCIIQMSL